MSAPTTTPAAPAAAPAVPVDATTPPPGSTPGPYDTLTELKGLVETERTIEATGERRLVRLPVIATIPQQVPPRALPPPPWPVVVLLGGFQSRSSMYRPLARRLASHGYAVLQYTSPLLKIIPDSEELPFLSAACGWLKRRVEAGDAKEDAPYAAPVPPNALDWKNAAIAGHSRGGKLAALHYARGFGRGAGEGAGGGEPSSSSSPSSFLPRFKACFLIDPVDNTPYTPEGPLYPSAVRALRELGGLSAATATAAAPPAPPLVAPPAPPLPLACATPAAAAAAMAMAASVQQRQQQPKPDNAPATPKIALVAAGVIGPSNPEGCNWRLFADAARDALPGSRVAVLPDAGHTTFMCAPPGGVIGAGLLDALFGGGGKRDTVLDRTAAAAVAWLDAELKGLSPGE
jgi:hypothetical protein